MKMSLHFCLFIDLSQTGLEKELLNSDMQDDVLMFNTRWLKDFKEKLSWGRLDVNLFLFGMGGVVTPAHYDIMENLFLQVCHI